MRRLSPTRRAPAAWAAGRTRDAVEITRRMSHVAPKQKPARIPFRRAVFILRQVWPALRVIIGGISVLVVVAATLERLVEPKVFTSFGLALWWAIVTIATVGY